MQMTILGCEAFSCALADLLARNGHSICMWGRNPERVQQLRFRGHHPGSDKPLPKALKLTSDLDLALLESQLIVESATTESLRELLQSLKRRKSSLPMILTSRAIEKRSGKFPTQIAQEIFGDQPEFALCVLSGPSIAEEIVAGKPTSVIMACRNLDVAAEFAKYFKTSQLSVLTHSDVIGVQLGGAFGEISAVLTGMINGMKSGTNAKAVCLVRGLQELTKLATALGCLPQTVYGLSGIGNILTCCLSPLGESLQLGESFAVQQDNRLKNAQNESALEITDKCRALLDLAQLHNCPMPVLQKLLDILDGSRECNCLREDGIELVKPEWEVTSHDKNYKIV